MEVVLSYSGIPFSGENFFLNAGAPYPKIVVSCIKVYLFLAKTRFLNAGAPQPQSRLGKSDIFLLLQKKRHFLLAQFSSCTKASEDLPSGLEQFCFFPKH